MVYEGDGDRLDEQLDPDDYPGLSEAYDFVLPSYAWATGRFQVADGRLQAIGALISATVLGAVAFIGLNDGVSFQSIWLYLVLAILVGSIALSVVAQTRWGPRLVHPGELYENHATDDRWEFRRAMVYYAGQHLTENARRIDLKTRATTTLLGVYMVEVILLSLWAASELG